MDRQHKSNWSGIRPLLWWLLLFLLLYGIRLNQRLLEQTRLYFSVTLNSQPLPYPVTVAWDGKPIQSGDKISLGSHRFSIIGPKTDSFTTNLFVFYGRHDFGDIRLMRSSGTLSVKADPPAELITISGPEFSTNIQDSSGVSLTVPTDLYTIEAEYRHWSDSQTTGVAPNSVSPVTFSPKFSSVDLTCNRGDATFQLQSDNGQIQDSGNFPSLVNDLPTGDYEATAIYHNRTMQKSVEIEVGITNEIPFQFALGALQLNTGPPGAEVRATDGNYLGQTPLLLPDITPQKAQITLSLPGYEPVSVALDVAADQTNSYTTNLVSVSYLSAIRDARAYLSASNYEAAFQAAAAAMKAKPEDVDALAIYDKAGSVLKANQARQDRLQRPKKWFDRLCNDCPYADQFTGHEVDTTKPVKEVAVAIAAALTNSPSPFKIIQDDSPEAGTYQIVAEQTGILDASERDCLIVVGQPTDTDTEVRFKVLDFEIQHNFVSTGLLKMHDDKRLVPLTGEKIQNNGLLQFQVRQGLAIVTDKIHRAIDK